MALRHLAQQAVSRPPGITCEDFVADATGKRCVHYHANGTCGLPSGFMCIEWLKVNAGHRPAALPALPANDPKGRHLPVLRDLFGNPIPDQPKSDAPSPATGGPVPRPEPVPSVDVDPLRGFTPDDIASFKALGVEVQFASDTLGAIWLVPAYTGQDRTEITPEHAALLVRTLSIFPGSTLIGITKPGARPAREEGAR